MKTYTIYHIPGIKVGVTSNFKRRHYFYPPGTVLIPIEELQTTAEEAGDREWYWADHYNYPRGPHYRHAGSLVKLRRNYKVSPETKEKIRSAVKGRKKTERTSRRFDEQLKRKLNPIAYKLLEF